MIPMKEGFHMDFSFILHALAATSGSETWSQYYTLLDPSSGQLTSLSQLTGQVNDLWLTAGTILSLVVSLICCFYGFRLSRLIMSLSGFLIGSWLGHALIAPLAGLKPPLSVLIGLVCGAILASAAWKIYKLGLCLLAFILAWSAAQILIPFGDIPKVVLCVFAGICAAILVLSFLRPGIILLTAIFGGIHASAGLLSLSNSLNLKIPEVFSGILPLSTGFVAAGILVQFIMTRHDD